MVCLVYFVKSVGYSFFSATDTLIKDFHLIVRDLIKPCLV